MNENEVGNYQQSEFIWCVSEHEHVTFALQMFKTLVLTPLRIVAPNLRTYQSCYQISDLKVAHQIFQIANRQPTNFKLHPSLSNRYQMNQFIGFKIYHIHPTGRATLNHTPSEPDKS